MEDNDHVLLVTGSSGFVAQHLIKEIQTKCIIPIREIRLVDRKPFKKYLDFPEKYPMKFYESDCTDKSKISEIARGCTAVFNLAAKKYPFNMYPDEDDYWRDNTETVEVLLDVLCEENVPFLIHVSDAMANLPNGDNFGSSEVIHMKEPNTYVMDIYGKTKCKAELLVRERSGSSLANGQKLCCAIIRPTMIYGEGDSCLVPHSLDMCKQFGCMWMIGCGNGGVFQLVYAGNVAAMLVRAWQVALERPDEINGEVFNCTEDSPAIQYYDYIRPFVEAAGYKLSPFRINYYVGFWSFWFLEKALTTASYLLSTPIGRQVPSCKMIRIVGAWCYGFNFQKSRLFLDFLPPYKTTQAMADTIEWWQKKSKDTDVTVFEQ